jgi:hypothetical protein
VLRHRYLAALEHLFHVWLSHYGLSLNPSKSDAVVFSTRQRRQSLMPYLHVNVSGTEIKLSDSLTTLGVIPDNDLTFNDRIPNLWKIISFHLRSLHHIRPCLTLDMTKSVSVAIVQSRLDYGNSLFFGTSQNNNHIATAHSEYSSTYRRWVPTGYFLMRAPL